MDFSPERKLYGSEQEIPPTPHASETEWGFFLLQDFQHALAADDREKIKFCREALSSFIGKVKDEGLREDLQRRWNEIESEEAARQARRPAA